MKKKKFVFKKYWQEILILILIIVAGAAFFYISLKEIQAASGTVRPNGDYGTMGWTKSSPAQTYHYQYIDEVVTQPTAGSADYLSAAASITDEFEMQTISMGSGARATDIKVWFYACATKAADISVTLYWTGGNSATQTVSPSVNTSCPSTGYGWASTTFSSLSLDQTKLDSLRVRMVSNTAGGRTTCVSTLYAVVTYYVPSITITSDRVVLYGSVGLGEKQNTTPSGVSETQTAKNDGGATEHFRIKSSDATRGGGTTWVLNTTAAANIYNHFASIDTANFTIDMLSTDTYVVLKYNVAVNESVNFDLQIGMPTDTNDTLEHSITITVMAEIP